MKFFLILATCLASSIYVSAQGTEYSYALTNGSSSEYAYNLTSVTQSCQGSQSKCPNGEVTTTCTNNVCTSQTYPKTTGQFSYLYTPLTAYSPSKDNVQYLYLENNGTSFVTFNYTLYASGSPVLGSNQEPVTVSVTFTCNPCQSTVNIPNGYVCYSTNSDNFTIAPVTINGVSGATLTYTPAG
ncbi:MAG: hypothetical protein K2Y01_05280 [Rhabdochlamydiaceae bacterium]|nr:hypothetical protein [Rhabdochlamydiaceae bacterium]